MLFRTARWVAVYRDLPARHMIMSAQDARGHLSI